METANTQPCLFAMEMAAFSVLKERGITPEVVAGFSLGEVVAATAAGLFDLETGFDVVCKRGELMQAAAGKTDIAMMAVVKLEAKQVEDICAKHTQVYPVNYNCPGQITVSGLHASMEAFSADVKAVGGRALPLKVKGAFHSPFMQEAANAFRNVLEQAEVKETVCTLYSNLTAKPYTSEVVATLSEQICSPVRWEELIRNMISEGVDTFIEIGPGKTLTNMIKKIDASVSAQTFTEYLAEVEVC
jgi:[acyl-carrier-protein] S-malonyltransferase